MVQLDVNRFLTELGKMFERTKEKGSVWITMKSSNNKPRSTKRTYPEEDYQCLVRAVSSGGKDKKREIATLVPAQAIMKFQQSMTTIMKVCGAGSCSLKVYTGTPFTRPPCAVEAPHASLSLSMVPGPGLSELHVLM